MAPRKGSIPWNKGIPHKEETKAKIADRHRGKKLSEEHKRKIGIGSKIAHARPEVKKRASEVRKGIPKTPEHNLKNSLAQRGEKGNNWQGGKSTQIQLIRSSAEYKLWRRSVFERDNYTCIWCGARSAKDNPVWLQADHIKPFAYFPELRFAIDNGRTLCKPCHKLTDSFGIKSKLNYGK